MIISTKKFITINHGNTNTSILLHEDGHSESLKTKQYFDDEYLQTLPGVITSVGPRNTSFPDTIQDIKTFHQDGYFLDMKVHYSKELGADRLINGYYIFKNELCPAENILHIDAGTFTTMDLISLNGFEGGFIFPGETTYLQSFNRGENLPSFSNAEISTNSTIPRDTESAIKQSYSIFMTGALTEVLMKYSPQSIIITGGNSISITFLLSRLNKASDNKFVKYKTIPKLTHKALSYFYQKNQMENLQ